MYVKKEEEEWKHLEGKILEKHIRKRNIKCVRLKRKVSEVKRKRRINSRIKKMRSKRGRIEKKVKKN